MLDTTAKSTPVRSVSLVRTQIVRETSVPYEGSRDCSNPSAAAAVAHAIIGGDAQEVVLAIMLDSKNRLLCATVVGKGTADRSSAHARDVFREAIMSNASKLILAHNHPSGDVTPSDADRSMTAALVTAGRVIGIPVIDHIIIGPDPLDGVASLRLEGLCDGI